MSEITDTDYKKILEFYEKPIPRSKRLLKMEAEKRELRRKRVGEDGMEQIDEDM